LSRCRVDALILRECSDGWACEADELENVTIGIFSGSLSFANLLGTVRPNHAREDVYLASFTAADCMCSNVSCVRGFTFVFADFLNSSFAGRTLFISGATLVNNGTTIGAEFGYDLGATDRTTTLLTSLTDPPISATSLSLSTSSLTTTLAVEVVTEMTSALGSTSWQHSTSAVVAPDTSSSSTILTSSSSSPPPPPTTPTTTAVFASTSSFLSVASFSAMGFVSSTKVSSFSSSANVVMTLATQASNGVGYSVIIVIVGVVLFVVCAVIIGCVVCRHKRKDRGNDHTTCANTLDDVVSARVDALSVPSSEYGRVNMAEYNFAPSYQSASNYSNAHAVSDDIYDRGNIEST
jgi:hypothetical protein